MKDRYFLALGVLVVSLFLFGCATTAELPSNAHIVEGSKGWRFLDKVDFSYTASKPYDFAALQLCVAQNVSNQGYTLTGDASTWRGPATSTYYRNDRQQHVVGSTNIFKFVDERNATLVAVGTTSSTQGGLMPATDIIRYELVVKLEGNHIGLVFSNITRAWENTGAASNDGFEPVGVWQGTRADNVYRGLEAIAQHIRACAP